MISILFRIEIVLFYVSLLSICLLLNNLSWKAVILWATLLLTSVIGFWLIERLLFPDIYQTIEEQNLRSLNSMVLFGPFELLRDMGCVVAALGPGITAVSIFMAYRFYKKSLPTFAAFFIWVVFPIVFCLFFATGRDLTRFLIPSFAGVILFSGIFIRDLSNNKPKSRLVFLAALFAVHFLGMPLSYIAVKQFYPLKRHYKPGERIVTEGVPIGNIFEDAFHLKLEKRREWNEAKRVLEEYDHVIVLSNNAYRIPFYYFFYLKEKKTALARFAPVPFQVLKSDQKKFLFLDVLPVPVPKNVSTLLSDQRFLDFDIYFLPYIPERVPEIYKLAESLSAKRSGKIIPQQG